MAPNKKTSKKTPRRRAPRTTNQNKATASNKTSVRVTVNPAPARRRGVANKGQSTAQPRGPQFVFLPAAQPAAQPQMIPPMSAKDLFELMRELKNPPPPTAAEIRDEPRRRNLLRPEDVFYHRRDAGFTDEPPMFVGGRMSDNVSSFDDDLSTTEKLPTPSAAPPSIDSTFNRSQSGYGRVSPMKGAPLLSLKLPGSPMNDTIDRSDMNASSSILKPTTPIAKGATIDMEQVLNPKLTQSIEPRVLDDSAQGPAAVAEPISFAEDVRTASQLEDETNRWIQKKADDYYNNRYSESQAPTPNKKPEKDEVRHNQNRASYIAKIKKNPNTKPSGLAMERWNIELRMAEDGLVWWDKTKDKLIAKVPNDN